MPVDGPDSHRLVHGGRAASVRRIDWSCRGGAVERINVIFVHMPRMLREIVKQAVESQPDMLVAAELDSIEQAVAVLRPSDRAVLVADGSLSAREVHRLLTRAPGSAILSVSATAGLVDTFQLRPVRRHFGEASAAGLLDVIRSVSGGGDEGGQA